MHLLVLSTLALLVAGQDQVCRPGTRRVILSVDPNDESIVATCEPCEPGTYQPLSGQSTCLTCPAGSFASLHSQESCAPCPKGTFADEKGSSRCRTCRDDEFAALEGSVICSKCPQGETSRNSTRSAVSDCACIEGSYKAEGGACEPCPENLFCPERQNPYPQPGYWVAKGEVTARLCRPRSACPGGPLLEDSGFAPCAANYEPNSRLCFVCKKDNFKLYDGDTCTACPFPGWGWLLLGLMPIVFLAITLLILALGRAPELGSLYIALTFFQVTALFSEINVKWPLTMPFMFTIFSFSNMNQDLYGFECTLDYGTRAGLTLAHPLFFAVLFVAVYLITVSSKSLSSRAFYVPRMRPTDRGTRTQVLRRHFLASYLTLLLLSFVYELRAFLDAVDCTEGEDGKMFLDAQPDVRCGSSRWVAQLIPSIVALVAYIGVPFALTVVIGLRLSREKRAAGGDRRVFQSHMAKGGFVTMRFRQRYYYWETVNLAYKAAMVLIAKLLSLRPLAAILLLAGVVLVMIVLQVWCRPYNCRPDNNLAIAVYVFQFIMAIIMLVFHFSSFSDSAADIVVAVAVIVTCATAIAAGAVALYEIRKLRVERMLGPRPAKRLRKDAAEGSHSSLNSEDLRLESVRSLEDSRKSLPSPQSEKTKRSSDASGTAKGSSADHGSTNTPPPAVPPLQPASAQESGESDLSKKKPLAPPPPLPKLKVAT